ncbi:MAG: hypothetical protein EKK45_00330 [Curvibacter sp.]|nr:MAG: hypothetical protein EKK45_00330 [Curvibacter sp.]
MKKMKTVRTSEISGRALAWAVALVQGRALREPVYATNDDVKDLPIPFTLYEVTHVLRNDVLVSTHVQPVTVERYGILQHVRATAPSITFRGADGRRSLGSVSMFFLTEEEAQLDAQLQMKGGLKGFDPENDWRQTGDLIDEVGIMFQSSGHLEVLAYTRMRGTSGPTAIGASHRQAALRLVVMLKFGKEIEVPAELLG